MRGDRTSFLTVFVFEKSSVSMCFGFGVFCFCEAETFGWTWDHAGLGVFVFRWVREVVASERSLFKNGIMLQRVFHDISFSKTTSNGTYRVDL